MKRGRLAEQSILFASVLKWFILATAVGLIVGLSTTLFLKALQWSFNFTDKINLYFLALPAGLVISVLLVKYLAPDAEGHGTEKVIEAVHKTSGRISPAVVPVKLAATIVTLTAGGSVGKEGPCAQIGAGLASLFADLIRLSNRDRKKLVICGISAGFASVFGTPIAGAIFGIEVLFVGSMLYEVLLPSFIAGVTAYEISTIFGIKYFNHPIAFVPDFTEVYFIKVVIGGLFFGFCSFLMVEALNWGKKLSNNIKIIDPLKGVIGGAALIGMTFLFSQKLLGLGLDTIENTLNGQDVPWYLFLAKMAFTSITLNFGGSGGIVTPLFFVGATAGTFFANIMGLHTATFAAIGMVSIVAGAANTPIAASIMAIELFGPKIGPYAAVSCVISFLMTGHRSVYPSQILAIKKSPYIDVPVGKVVEEIAIEIQPGSGFIPSIIKLAKKIFKFSRNKSDDANSENGDDASKKESG